MMMSNDYWKKRALQRMYEYQQMADDTANDIADAYIKSTRYINSEIEKIFRTYSIDCGISEKEAKELLTNLPDNAKLDNLKEIINEIKDPNEKQDFINIINSPAYAYRIRRLEELQSDIDEQTKKLAEFEQNITKSHYVNLTDYAYNRAIFDIQRGTGIGFAFNKMSTSRVNQILKQNWSGKLFSERIWGKTNEINRALKQELLTGFMTGRPYNKTAKEIESRMSVGAMEARRLVRTESTYITNSAEMEGYSECNIDKYRFVATLDKRTSAICASLDGKIFDVKNAIAGTNMPPMHPWCRSTTVAVIDSDTEAELTRAAKDPVTGKWYKVPANMTYDEWKKSVDEKYADGTFDKMKKMYVNEKQDRKQYEKYKALLGKKNMPETFDMFQDLKYNNIEEWEDFKGFYRYKCNNLKATRNDYNCVKELRKLSPQGSFHVPAREIDVKILAFDDKHVNGERNHKVTEDMAKDFINKAKMSKTVWSGQYERYYSYDGAAYVNNVKKEIRTSYTNNEFDTQTQQIMEVLKKYGI